MTRRGDGRAIIAIGAVALVLVAVLMAVVLIQYFVEGNRITTIERQVRTVNHEIVTLPCVHGNTRTCRRFLALLLSDATKQQLRRLLAAKKFRLTPPVLRGIRRLEGVMPGNPHAGHGLPGRHRAARTH